MHLISLFAHPASLLHQWVKAMGLGTTYLLLFMAIFLETGIVVLPIVPGDSLLLASGVFASISGQLQLGVLIPLLAVGAFLGDQSNYFIGRFLGEKILKNPKWKKRLSSKLSRSEDILNRFGKGAMFFSHFIPVGRTFIPFLCGISGLPWKKFSALNAPGDCLWAIILLSIGYFCAKIPFVKKYLGLIALIAVGCLVVSVLISFFRSKKKKGKGKHEKQANEGL
ncbi:MAG: VTT domain-containing protein [Aeriscardovia sp.]|nr:VTT domain-containing protein [Aeriscardovia sp.]